MAIDVHAAQTFAEGEVDRRTSDEAAGIDGEARAVQVQECDTRPEMMLVSAPLAVCGAIAADRSSARAAANSLHITPVNTPAAVPRMRDGGMPASSSAW
jgi:hypothetical protein